MKRSTLGSKIRSLRKQSDMTQAALADKLGVTDKAVSKWERDISYPDISLFPKLADVLGVTADDLLKECVDENRLLQIFEMSHDIRTPLNIILGSAELAEADHEDEKSLLRYLKNIRLSGNYLLQMIDRLMEVTSKDAVLATSDIVSTDGSSGTDESSDTDESSGTKAGGANDMAEGVDNAKTRPAGPDHGVKAAENYDFSGKRILLVEDVAVNREITAELLKRTGAEIEFAEDGLICIDKMTDAPEGYYDLILMDIRMPNMDGIEATQQVRRMTNEKKAAIPIIAMTANVYEKDRNAAFEAGMNGFTEKPIVVEKLLSTVNRYI